jgi:beta-lactam-binding protein with PASTA domain
LPPARPSIAAQPPESRGLGFGGFLLGLLLLTGVLGLIYLGATGIFNDLFNFTSGAPAPPQPTVVAEQPTPAPTGLPFVLVPNLSGLDSAQARSTIEAATLTSREELPRYNDTVSIGLVIDQFPLAGGEVTATSVITYAVSLGPEPVSVPDVSGFRAADAQTALERAGFQVQIQEQASGAMDAGFVIRSEPGPNTRPPRGDTITIFVSIGDRVRMPDVTGLNEEEAKRQINEAGLNFSFSDYQGPDKIERFNEIAPGTVVSSVPRGGDLVERGTAVTLGVRAP